MALLSKVGGAQAGHAGAPQACQWYNNVHPTGQQHLCLTPSRTLYDVCIAAAPVANGAVMLRVMPRGLNSKAWKDLNSFSVPLGPISMEGACSVRLASSSTLAPLPPPAPPGRKLCTLALTLRNSLGGMKAGPMTAVKFACHVPSESVQRECGVCRLSPAAGQEGEAGTGWAMRSAP